MSFDALENWLDSVDEPPMVASGVQPVSPNSLDQLLNFTENGICVAMAIDYWDLHGLEERLTANVVTSMPEANSVFGAHHFVVAGPLPDTATPKTPPGTP
uniref:Uncharacterized protein n=1 Tax=Timema poppense TaxID=170557 RepID=A0A7R9HED3_TIMPO|nr:unnamed protein product [Timema poppensis]